MDIVSRGNALNLLKAEWLPMIAGSGKVEYCSPASLTDPDIVDIKLPRADFYGAVYQFLIGLLQTVFPPKTYDEWMDRWLNPPSREELSAALDKFAPAFNIDGDGPRFMQDFDLLEGVKRSSIAGLLIDSPGENGIKSNTDFFIKRGGVDHLSPVYAALALFTLQINAPSGGAGHRVGLRGGGPLTTLAISADKESSLWKRLWLNVVPIPAVGQKGQQWVEPTPDNPLIFPWMGPTQTSEKNQEVFPEMVHPLHAYWAMPRRIRLEFDDVAGVCDISGQPSDRLVFHVRSKNYGANYGGPWLHPFTPFKTKPNNPAELPLSAKPQPEGLGYRHWSNWVFSDSKSGNITAGVITDYLNEKYPLLQDEYNEKELDNAPERHIRIWAFGYDMDNMKPRGWYSTEMPLIVSSAHEDELKDWSRIFVDLSLRVAGQLRTQIKYAWFDRPKEVSGDVSFITAAFYDATQSAFFETIHNSLMAMESDNKEERRGRIFAHWHKVLQAAALKIFDLYVLAGAENEISKTQTLKRAIDAKRRLGAFLSGRGKDAKEVREFINNGGFGLATDTRWESA